NFQQSTFEAAAALSGEEVNAAHRVARRSCDACTIGCEHIYEKKVSGAFPGERVLTPFSVRLEYESLFALGPLCGIGDADVVLRASRLCDDLGIDTISAGGTIAFAMECVERGWLDEPWLSFGSGDAMLRAIELIGRREGVG